MKFFSKFFLLLSFTVFTTNMLWAQIEADPTTWSFEVKKKSGNDYDLILKVDLKKEWHLYSMNPGGDGSLIAPSFSFNKNKDVKLVGKIKEKGKNKLITETIDGIDGAVHYYEDHITYTQAVTVTKNTKITGEYSYQTCNHEKCLNPTTKPFSFEIKDAIPTADTAQADTTEEAIATTNVDTVVAPLQASSTPTDTAAPTKDDGIKNKMGEQKSLLVLFLLALGGGLLAVTTPCVYSMIPITVSFFTKRSKTRAEGIRNSIYYSLSIIIIFTGLGVLLSAIFGPTALNDISTHWIANLLFFVMFLVFGISFLGAFEITLPSSWTSKTDSKAGTNSFSGIFFMALTLVIVSFSCTGPIVGTLIVDAARRGIAGPTVGMFGFSVGLALPFALFAVFPGMLNKMASGGGWLNQVKVTLGFVELALAMKFLSNADLQMGWRLLDREIFIAIWIVIAIMLGIYLLGKLKLSHDDANAKNVFGQEYVSLFKLFLAMASFTFAVYLFPGMWGAPLNGMSAFLPPMGTQDYVITAGGSGAGGGTNETEIHPKKYVEEFKVFEPIGLTTFYDYAEGMAAAKKLNKPVMLDFTGINCVNCRKMENQVWSSAEVHKRLKNDFIVISLFSDAQKVKLLDEDVYFSKELNKQVTTVGEKNSDLQVSKFNSNSQPFYFFVDNDGNKLIEKGYGYDPDVEKFVAHLEKAKAAYKQKK